MVESQSGAGTHSDSVHRRVCIYRTALSVATPDPLSKFFVLDRSPYLGRVEMVNAGPGR